MNTQNLSPSLTTLFHELVNGMIASIVHLGYQMGAMRQISKDVRGPKEVHGSTD